MWDLVAAHRSLTLSTGSGLAKGLILKDGVPQAQPEHQKPQNQEMKTAPLTLSHWPLGRSLQRTLPSFPSHKTCVLLFVKLTSGFKLLSVHPHVAFYRRHTAKCGVPCTHTWPQNTHLLALFLREPVA